MVETLYYFYFILNAVFFGTFYASMNPTTTINTNIYQVSYAVAISSLKNDAIFNVYLPLLCDIFQVSNKVVFQFAFVCTHCLIINRSGISYITYFIFHIEHIIVLSFFFIGTNHIKQIMLYFLNFLIIHVLFGTYSKKKIDIKI